MKMCIKFIILVWVGGMAVEYGEEIAVNGDLEVFAVPTV